VENEVCFKNVSTPIDWESNIQLRRCLAMQDLNHERYPVVFLNSETNLKNVSTQVDRETNAYKYLDTQDINRVRYSGVFVENEAIFKNVCI